MTIVRPAARRLPLYGWLTADADLPAGHPDLDDRHPLAGPGHHRLTHADRSRRCRRDHPDGAAEGLRRPAGRPRRTAADGDHRRLTELPGGRADPRAAPRRTPFPSRSCWSSSPPQARSAVRAMRPARPWCPRSSSGPASPTNARPGCPRPSSVARPWSAPPSPAGWSPPWVPPTRSPSTPPPSPCAPWCSWSPRGAWSRRGRGRPTVGDARGVRPAREVVVVRRGAARGLELPARRRRPDEPVRDGGRHQPARPGLVCGAAAGVGPRLGRGRRRGRTGLLGVGRCLDGRARWSRRRTAPACRASRRTSSPSW